MNTGLLTFNTTFEFREDQHRYNTYRQIFLKLSNYLLFISDMKFQLTKIWWNKSYPRWNRFATAIVVLISWIPLEDKYIRHISFVVLPCDSFAWFGCVSPNNHFLLTVECSRTKCRHLNLWKTIIYSLVAVMPKKMPNSGF